MSAQLCPECPGCGRRQEMTIGSTQAFCVSPQCPVLVWDPSMTAEDNLKDSVFTNLTDERTS